MGKLRVIRDAEAWRDLIDRQAASGLNQVAFCAQEGISKTSFQKWKRRLSASRGVPVQAIPQNEAPFFAELTVPASERPSATVESAPASTWQIELELGGGIVLRMQRGFSC